MMGRFTSLPQLTLAPFNDRETTGDESDANLEPRVLRLLGQRWVAGGLPGDLPLTEEPENSGLEIGQMPELD